MGIVGARKSSTVCIREHECPIDDVLDCQTKMFRGGTVSEFPGALTQATKLVMSRRTSGKQNMAPNLMSLACVGKRAPSQRLPRCRYVPGSASVLVFDKHHSVFLGRTKQQLTFWPNSCRIIYTGDQENRTVSREWMSHQKAMITSMI